jgi:hypothetical protein
MSKEKKNQESTEVVAQGSTAVAAVANLEEWGSGDVSSKDLIIPKILAMQGLSDFVTEGKAKFGDFVDSVSGEVLGSVDKPIKFVPFYMEKVWIISSRKKGEKKYEFDRYEAVTPANENAYPFEEVIGDTEFKYEYTHQYYVLRPEDTSMPYVLSFKSTSLRAGKVLSTQMYIRNRAAGLNPAAITMELGGKKEKNDNGTFVVMEVKPAGATSAELQSDALMWLKTIKAGKHKVAADKPAAADDAKFAQDVGNNF